MTSELIQMDVVGFMSILHRTQELKHLHGLSQSLQNVLGNQDKPLVLIVLLKMNKVKDCTNYCL